MQRIYTIVFLRLRRNIHCFARMFPSGWGSTSEACAPLRNPPRRMVCAAWLLRPLRSLREIKKQGMIQLLPQYDNLSYPLPAFRRYSPYLKGRAPCGVYRHCLQQVKTQWFTPTRVVLTEVSNQTRPLRQGEYRRKAGRGYDSKTGQLQYRCLQITRIVFDEQIYCWRNTTSMCNFF